jgi:hypothetical protein
MDGRDGDEGMVGAKEDEKIFRQKMSEKMWKKLGRNFEEEIGGNNQGRIR